MIQCSEYSKGKCGGEVCRQGAFPRCARYEPARKYKAFGYVVTVGFDGLRPDREFHWHGLTENAARRKAMLKPNARTIHSIEPLNEEQWTRAYGIPGSRM